MNIPVALPWKIGTGIGAVVSIGLGVSLLLAQVEVRSLTKQRDNYSTRLVTCEANTTTLKSALKKQNDKVQSLADQRTAAQQIAAQQMKIAQDARRRADKAALQFTPPKGDTLAARVLDADARVMEGLK